MLQGRLPTRTELANWPFGRLLSFRLLLVVTLVLACLASAMAVINTSHLTREQYARLQQLERERDQLQTEWGSCCWKRAPGHLPHASSVWPPSGLRCACPMSMKSRSYGHERRRSQ